MLFFLTSKRYSFSYPSYTQDKMEYKTLCFPKQYSIVSFTMHSVFACCLHVLIYFDYSYFIFLMMHTFCIYFHICICIFILLLLYEWLVFYVCLLATYTFGPCGGQNRASDPLKQGLEAALIHYVGAGSQTLVLAWAASALNCWAISPHILISVKMLCHKLD